MKIKRPFVSPGAGFSSEQSPLFIPNIGMTCCNFDIHGGRMYVLPRANFSWRNASCAFEMKYL